VRWAEIGELPCSVARALAVVGDRWTLLILRDCFLGARRFDEFQASLGLSSHLLSTRLAKLVEEQILERRLYSERPERHEYRLTAKGRDLYPVIGSLLRWGDRWMAGPEGPPFDLVHESCGHPSDPTLSCSACGDPLEPRDLRLEPNPELAELIAKNTSVHTERARAPRRRTR
jgi:DNA-binding HxlR family transcriptional regulator